MPKIYYLDANICIDYMRGRNIALRDKINAIPSECIKIPSIVKGELLLGAAKSKRRKETLIETLIFCMPYEIVPFEDSILRTYAEMRAALELRGQKIGYNDSIIAATVLVKGGVLVTNNIKEFSRVDGLVLEDWTQE